MPVTTATLALVAHLEERRFYIADAAGAKPALGTILVEEVSITGALLMRVEHGAEPWARVISLVGSPVRLGAGLLCWFVHVSAR